jgi:hypothetical protein
MLLKMRTKAQLEATYIVTKLFARSPIGTFRGLLLLSTTPALYDAN